MFRNWSETEMRIQYSADTIGSDAWNGEEKTPVFTPPPARDQDAFTRLRDLAPHLVKAIPAAKLPCGKITYSTAMLNAMMRAEAFKLQQQEKQIKSDAEASHAKTQLMKPGGTKLLTNDGKIISIIQGYTLYRAGGQWYPRGDKFATDPAEMIDNLVKHFFRRGNLLTTSKIWYNRDPKFANNRLIWHYDHVSQKQLVDRTEEIKLLLR